MNKSKEYIWLRIRNVRDKFLFYTMGVYKICKLKIKFQGVWHCPQFPPCYASLVRIPSQEEIQTFI